MRQRALTIGQAALQKKATDVVILEVEPLTSVADYFIFCSGSSERQVKAIADGIAQELVRCFSFRATIEGGSSATWILLDYGDIVVHVFRDDIRAFYGVEKMWRDAEEIPQSEFDSLPTGSFPTRTITPPVVTHQAR
ncbi:MAG: ribosome silencing factor [Nitrospirales bacterium]